MNLQVGQTASRSITLTEQHVKAYAEITGDYNPIHFDKTFASKTKFGKLVVQGGLTTGLLHALVAMDMPGPGTVFLNQTWQFTAPVFIGDTVHARLSVKETRPMRRLGGGSVLIDVNVLNQHDDSVMRGVLTVLVADRPQGE